ncbi:MULTISPECIES: extracellular solute-binding protein [unclassified Streptomyces]|uniref:extracellular solute-binding protein n=1 Tax=unclassified Streptomyces TaxID=2593676 RepID=UPI002DD80D8C|nr:MULTISPECIES: extracellular solute-binding protein [unclassified Streptomyces]WSA91813.1 extracellular solute-binding protein [Streptomyces sp. NBC_01795]WSB76183.1 extracellular solute-binding protein [Streptomyces sp. NBC_01775]WSS15543.1 extracellular solute-binding protein [Streptomyces sp. NBC_01186]WSS44384.1 extracellular solute-binding protein [Streptomyces sp. NBC_01187]
MNRRAVAAGAAALAMALGATACGGDSGDSGDKNTIKLVAADYGDKASNASKIYWNDVAKDFEKKNKGIKVDVQVINWNEIDKQVKTMIQSGNVPDLLQTGGYADKVADDLLYKADEVMSPKTRGNLIGSFAKAGEVDGTQYGIPWVSSTRVLFYNKKVFKKAGIKSPPKTWDEVADAAKKIKSSKAADTPYALPLGPEETQGESMIWEMGNGGGFTDSGGKYTVDSKANVETFKWLQDNLVKPKLTYDNPATTDRKTAFGDFAAGKAGMLNGHPSLVSMAKEGKVDYGVTTIPGKNGPLKSTLGVADWMMAFKDGGKKEQVKKFLDFTYSKKMKKFDEMYNFMPVTKDTLQDMQSSGKHKDLEPFFKELPNAKFYPLGDPAWDVVSAEMKKTGGKAVQEDPKKILGDLQKKAEEAASNK